MKTLIVTAETLVKNYRINMMEHLYIDNNESVDSKEFAVDLQNLGNDILGMLSPMALSTFRSLFQQGSTMMMLSPDDFDQVEQWNRDHQDFRIAIFKQDGYPVGIVGSEFVNY